MKETVKIVDISPTGEGVFNLPADLKGWRLYRLEYGGCNEDCLFEGRVLLPPRADPEAICNFIMGAQAHEQIWEKI